MPRNHTPSHHTRQDSSGLENDRHIDLCLTTHNTQKRKTSMHPAGFEPIIPGKRVTSDARLRPRGHRDRHQLYFGPLHYATNVPGCHTDRCLSMIYLYHNSLIHGKYSSTKWVFTWEPQLWPVCYPHKWEHVHWSHICVCVCVDLAQEVSKFSEK